MTPQGKDQGIDEGGQVNKGPDGYQQTNLSFPQICSNTSFAGKGVEENGSRKRSAISLKAGDP